MAYLGAARLLAAAPLCVPPAKLSPPAAGGLTAALVLAKLRASAAVVLAWAPWGTTGENMHRTDNTNAREHERERTAKSGVCLVDARRRKARGSATTAVLRLCTRKKNRDLAHARALRVVVRELPASGEGRRAESVRLSVFPEWGRFATTVSSLENYSTTNRKKEMLSS